MSAQYQTIAGSVETELEISRSRFVTRLERVDTERAAREVIARVRAEHPRARHHCVAFVLGPDARLQRSSDDGEPSGTAGAPMLDVLNRASLSDVVTVVTRYFGGVLLGASGLTRAYRAAVGEAVQAATIVQRVLRRRVTVRSSYEAAGQLEAEARRRGWDIDEAEYGEAVVRNYAVAEEQVAALTALAAELSAGAATVQPRDTVYVDLPAT